MPPRKTIVTRAALCTALLALAACSEGPPGFGRADGSSDGARSESGSDARSDAHGDDVARDTADDTSDAALEPDAADASDAPNDEGLDVPVVDAPRDEVSVDVPMVDTVDAARCTMTETLCSGSCVDTRSDRANCGSCGNACSPGLACVAGACTCPEGSMRCGGECIDTSSSGANCGTCGNTCGSGQSCTAGVCTCSAGQTRCGDRCVFTATDDGNCGTCGTVCTAGQTCMMGRCVCPGGLARCGATCVDLQSNASHCGACGTVCPTGQLCNGGSCAITCSGGRTRCTSGSTVLCADLQSDNANCGACGNACGAGLVCRAGTCACDTSTPGTRIELCGTGAAAMCTDVLTNVNHCGACGNACGAGRECRNGVCTCTGGLLLCGVGAAATCVDGSSDVNNCGACASRCVAGPNVQLTTCMAGSCRITCAPGFADCDRDIANGCEVDTRSDTAHCGACGNRCTAAGQTCRAGACGCPTGRTSCGAGAAATCRDLQSDNANCGACGNACPSAQTCQSGACACPVAGQILCNGVCVDPQTSNAHCGACGTACTGGMAPDLRTCRGGMCQCPAGQTFCAAQNRCVNTQTDPLNCSACGTICPGQPGGPPSPGGAQVCSNGTCGLSCAAGTTMCGSGATQTCANLQIDNANCGMCNRACTGGKTCTAGSCQCPSGQTDCGGTCRTLASDNANCGACGNACPSGTTCSNNQCVCSGAGLSLCPPCPAMTSCSASAMCLNLQSSNANCGMCGRACGAGSTCMSGNCVCGSAGQTYCASVGACIDPQTSSAHCGGCDRACTGTQTCVMGSCQSAYPSRVSVSSVGAEGEIDSYTEVHESISGDGRYVAFTSYASNLTPGVTLLSQHIYVRDRSTGATQLIDVSPAGAEGNGDADYAVISHDGRYVAFVSYATNLVSGVSTAEAHVYVRDRTNNSTVLATRSSAGAVANNGSLYPALSGDGRYVAYTSFATNLVPGADAGNAQVYVRDLQANTTSLVSASTTNGDGNSSSQYASLSYDGRYVVFASFATNLVAGSSSGPQQIYLRDRMTNTTTRVSTASGGTPGNGNSEYAVISADGSRIAYVSRATNLVSGISGSQQRIYVRTRSSGATVLASVSTGGVGANNAANFPTLSSDARYVSFTSTATNLVTGSVSGEHVYVRDLTGGTTALVDRSSAGVVGNNRGYAASLSADGRFVAFTSDATNLVSGDTNASPDVFVTLAH